MLDNDMKEVYFGEYCITCKHRSVPESDEPCFECLEEPLNQNSHKPVKWEEN